MQSGRFAYSLVTTEKSMARLNVRAWEHVVEGMVARFSEDHTVQGAISGSELCTKL